MIRHMAKYNHSLGYVSVYIRLVLLLQNLNELQKIEISRNKKEMNL